LFGESNYLNITLKKTIPKIKLKLEEIFETPTTAPVRFVFDFNKKKIPIRKNSKLKNLKYFFFILQIIKKKVKKISFCVSEAKIS
jgi:hypothetical protein